jgi:hypothetical protein
MSSFFGPARKRIRDWGWRRAAYWQLMHGLKKLLGLHVHYVSVEGVSRSRPKPEVPPGYDTRLGGKEDFVPFIDKVPSLDAEFVEQAFARGDECTFTMFEGELVAFCFSSRGRTRVTEQLDCLVPSGFRYGYKDWTHENHRRRNLSKMDKFLRNAFCERPSHERRIVYIETHNYASLLHGYRHPRERDIRMGLVGWIDLFGRQIPFSSGRAKWLGFEFVRREDDRPRQYV